MKKAIKYLCTLEGLLVYIIFSNYYQLKNFSFTFFECIKSFQSLTKTYYLIYCAPELYWWIWIRNFQIYKKRNFTEYITNHVYFGERQCQLTLLIISKPSSSNHTRMRTNCLARITTYNMVHIIRSNSSPSHPICPAKDTPASLQNTSPTAAALNLRRNSISSISEECSATSSALRVTPTTTLVLLVLE